MYQGNENVILYFLFINMHAYMYALHNAQAI